VNEILKECQRSQAHQELLYHDCVVEDGDSADRDDASVIESLNAACSGAMDPVFDLCAGAEVHAVLFGQDVPLTDIQREVLNLLYLEGLNTQEAAVLLKVSHQNVSKQHRKAIEICRTYLGVTVH